MTFWDFIASHLWFSFGVVVAVCMTLMSMAEDLSNIGRK